MSLVTAHCDLRLLLLLLLLLVVWLRLCALQPVLSICTVAIASNTLLVLRIGICSIVAVIILPMHQQHRHSATSTTNTDKVLGSHAKKHVPGIPSGTDHIAGRSSWCG